MVLGCPLLSACIATYLCKNKVANKRIYRIGSRIEYRMHRMSSLSRPTVTRPAMS